MSRSDWIFPRDENTSYHEVRIIVTMHVFTAVTFYAGVGSEVRGMGFFVVFFAELFSSSLCRCSAATNRGHKSPRSPLRIRNIIKEKAVEGERHGA